MFRELTKEEMDDIRKDPNNKDWFYIPSDYKLSEDFIREIKDYIDWHQVSAWQKLSKQFIVEFIDKLYVEALLNNKNLDQEIKDFIKVFND